MRTKGAKWNCHRCILHHCSPEHAFKRLNPDFLIHRLSPAFAAPRFISSNLVNSDERSSLLLWSESWSTNVGTSQLDAENALHVGEHLLVWSGGTVLELLDNGGSGVALGGQVLLGHLWLHLLALGRDGVTDNLADGVWLDDIVRAVNLGQVLALNTWLGGLLSLLVSVPCFLRCDDAISRPTALPDLHKVGAGQ